MSETRFVSKSDKKIKSEKCRSDMASPPQCHIVFLYAWFTECYFCYVNWL